MRSASILLDWLHDFESGKALSIVHVGSFSLHPVDWMRLSDTEGCDMDYQIADVDAALQPRPCLPACPWY